MAAATIAAIVTIVGGAVTAWEIGARPGDAQWDFERVRRDMNLSDHRNDFVRKRRVTYEFWPRGEWKLVNREHGDYVRKKGRGHMVDFQPFDGHVRNTWKVSSWLALPGRYKWQDKWRRRSRLLRHEEVIRIFAEAQKQAFEARPG